MRILRFAKMQITKSKLVGKNMADSSAKTSAKKVKAQQNKTKRR